MRKSHPLRRVVLAGVATVSGIVVLLSLKPGTSATDASAAGDTAPQQSAAAQESAQGGAQAATGTATGDAVDTQYGAIQVRITFVNNKITKAETVQQPKGGQSDQITGNAVPKLNAATLAKQSAQIDTVSGATYTSEGYKKSLQSAIDKGNAAAAAGASSPSPSPSKSAGNAQAAAPKTVTGTVSQTQYGPVQVRITVTNGKITKAEAVKQPTGGQSDQVNGNAIPKLNQAAVAAGDADIDAVSGATYTSAGYKQSLQSALDQAGG
ncbi:FMN-binding protein [Streptomyces sp. S3(2020)]|uniref:FMN-binding protein n=1 Tax=Streptomyces sp. S3(2020) TaxID=2732044 RepID=UPI001487715F|nr:FMN-binding protein [Streptomyces sp. S3(2020)]NNN32409.1 FMN-binding protein [Streptomyces sp. S3(2020)]